MEINNIILIGVSLSFGMINTIFCKSSWAQTTINVGWEVMPKAIDPRLIGADANAQYLEELRYLPLISFDASGNLLKILLENYSFKDRVWKFVLKKGFTFNNGQEITANDVVATYEAVRAANSLSPRKGSFENILSLTKSNDYEITINLKEPDVEFITNMVIGILPASFLKNPSEHPLGKGLESGPFLLDSVLDREIILKKNPKYLGKISDIPIPKIDQVSFKIIPDNGTRYAALLKDLLMETLYLWY